MYGACVYGIWYVCVLCVCVCGVCAHGAAGCGGGAGDADVVGRRVPDGRPALRQQPHRDRGPVDHPDAPPLPIIEHMS